MQNDQNRLFVAHKPPFISSNRFLGQLRRKYGVKKAGYSGTLDPFAKGCLIVAFGQYTKLFGHLLKAPKVYRATLWLGAKSPSLDIENLEHVTLSDPVDPLQLTEACQSLVGTLRYIPPRYSAAKVNGRRAYALAREAKEVVLKEREMTVYGLRLLLYNHPFITFEAEVSEGAYIRSLGQMLAAKVDRQGTLSSLERISEGKFLYNNELGLSPIPYINAQTNVYKGDFSDLLLGRKLIHADFENPAPGRYLLKGMESFSLIDIDETGRVEYKLNRMTLC